MSPCSHKIMNLYFLRTMSLYSRRTKNPLMMSPILRMSHSFLSTLCPNTRTLTIRTMSSFYLSIARSTRSYIRSMSPMRRPRARLGLTRSSTSTFNLSKRLPTIKTPGVRKTPIVNSLSHSSKPKLTMNHNPTSSDLAFRLPRRIGMDRKMYHILSIMRFLR